MKTKNAKNADLFDRIFSLIVNSSSIFQLKAMIGGFYFIEK